MARSLHISSTTGAPEAGITILLRAGASSALVHRETLCLPPLPPPQHLLHVPPSQEALWDNTPVPPLIQERPPPPPLLERGESARWCLKAGPVALLREGE